MRALPPLPARIYDESMSFSDTIFLFFLALILFGPKKLPEMARQAGRLLAELRRASNEFRSQIETEIAHLEVQKNQAVLPPSPSPQGSVPNLSPDPAASDLIPHNPDSPATLAAPAAEVAAVNSNPVPESNSIPATEAISEASDAASQASHV
jgi:sec-independent protein translocase protein TatB